MRPIKQAQIESLETAQKLQFANIYNISVQTYSTSQNVMVVTNCAGFMFTNLGSVIARVNGMVIYPGVPGVSLGDSRSIGLNKLDLYKGNIVLSFDAGAGALVEIVQLFYTESF